MKKYARVRGNWKRLSRRTRGTISSQPIYINFADGSWQFSNGTSGLFNYYRFSTR